MGIQPLILSLKLLVVEAVFTFSGIILGPKCRKVSCPYVDVGGFAGL